MYENKLEILNSKLNILIEKSKEVNYITNITKDRVAKARELIKINAYSMEDFFILLASINLLNAAIKDPAYSNGLTYSEIKGNVIRILHYLVSQEKKIDNMDYYINLEENCAYIEIYDFQFSFHKVKISEKLKAFLNSGKNQPKPWKQIRLQKIAAEIFDLSMELADMKNAYG